jgi:predicted transcriptional regulator
MSILNLIDRDFGSVSILEEMSHIERWLEENPYFAIIDENMNTVGILVKEDAVCNSANLVIDCDFKKPSVSPMQSLKETLSMMQSQDLSYLPVFQASVFIGVISSTAIHAALRNTA